jgi:hypothetical protein
MKSRTVIFAVLAVMLIIFSPFSTFAVTNLANESFAKCTSTGKHSENGLALVKCCWEAHEDSDPSKKVVTYCSTCEDGGTRGKINCTDPTKQALKLPTDESGPAGEVLEEQTTTPLEGTVLEAQRANITVLPGGGLQAENNTTFSGMNISTNDSTSGILEIEESNLVSDEAENKTETVNDGEEQDESGPSKEQTSKRTDESDDKENIDEELPLE